MKKLLVVVIAIQGIAIYRLMQRLRTIEGVFDAMDFVLSSTIGQEKEKDMLKRPVAARRERRVAERRVSLDACVGVDRRFRERRVSQQPIFSDTYNQLLGDEAAHRR